MFASLILDALNLEYLISNPWLLLVFAFQVWMFVDAVRRQEWFWAVFIFIGFGLSASSTTFSSIAPCVRHKRI